MRNVKTLTLTLAAAWMLTACTAPEEADLLPAGPRERVDLSLTGVVQKHVSSQSDDGLIYLAENAEPYLNPNEYAIRVRLDESTSLRLLIYRYGEDYPIVGDNSFSAYPPDALEDRISYVVMQYLDNTDRVLFSTTTSTSPPHIQADVLEISQGADLSLFARLRGVRLYRNTDSLRAGEGSEDASDFVAISGTFRIFSL